MHVSCLLNFLPTAILGNFSCFFLLSADFVSKSTFLKTLSVIPSVSNTLDPDQAGHFVRPDLGPNCVQRLSTDYPSPN